MSKVLVPIDGSETAMHALRHAMKDADELHVITVQIKPNVPVLLLHMTQEDIDKVQLEHGHSILADARKLLEEAGRPYRTHVLLGEPAAHIARVAKSEGVDLIVMGTRGMGSLGNLVLGSTATKVVHLAEVPVTLVK